MTLVVDASLVISALTAPDDEGAWSSEQLLGQDLVAPQVMPLEATSALRFAEFRKEISSEVASRAYADLLNLRVELYPFALFADRVWQLRANVTPSDAWYVALAEWLQAPLATLDRRLTRASGPRCGFLTPSG